MKRLRALLLIYAAAALVGAYFIATTHLGLLAALYAAFNGSAIALAVIFERGRYKPNISSDQNWEDTDEKFQDDTTGKWMVVRYNRQTGERDYVELKTHGDNKDGRGKKSEDTK